ncbi:hypothetical protein [Mycobacterium kubicae]|uniref:hypothetical protein n=1 Tax=Mycobacterium kubicae TaxID=120959 RepID=UPI000A42369E|nr:hypothetical protein [Mycobacterium kubicae]
MKFKPLTAQDLRLNEQAAAVAASVLNLPVEAAARCEQQSTTSIQMYPSGGGEVYSRRVSNGTGLPKSFILAVTRDHVHALEDKQRRGELVGGAVLKSWERNGFRAQLGNAGMGAGLPGDRQLLMLWLPIDADSSEIAQRVAQQRAAAGQRAPGVPHSFVLAKDGPSRRVVDALGATVIGSSQDHPKVTIGNNAKIRIAPGANVRIGGQRIQDLAAPPAATPSASSAAQRLQELETLRAGGLVTQAEYESKRQQIIAEL